MYLMYGYAYMDVLRDAKTSENVIKELISAVGGYPAGLKELGQLAWNLPTEAALKGLTALLLKLHETKIKGTRPDSNEIVDTINNKDFKEVYARWIKYSVAKLLKGEERDDILNKMNNNKLEINVFETIITNHLQICIKKLDLNSEEKTFVDIAPEKLLSKKAIVVAKKANTFFFLYTMDEYKKFAPLELPEEIDIAQDSEIRSLIKANISIEERKSKEFHYEELSTSPEGKSNSQISEVYSVLLVPSTNPNKESKPKEQNEIVQLEIIKGHHCDESDGRKVILDCEGIVCSSCFEKYNFKY